MSSRIVKIAAAGGVVGALALGGAAWAVAGGGSDGPSPTGPQAAKARAAAVAAVGGGKVNAIERDSEDGATWEVEVTKTSGDTVDVRLDAAYTVVVVDSDSETAGDRGGDKADKGGADDGAGDD